MGTLMENNPSETVDLLERARAGDPQALNEIFTRHRDPVAPHGRNAPRLAAAGPDRRFRRDSRRLLGGRRPDGGIPSRSETAAVPLATAGGRRTTAQSAPGPPGRPNALCR